MDLSTLSPITNEGDAPPALGALLRADQPWGDAFLARLYDAFPFAADLPLYQDLAAAEGGRVLEVACGSGRVLVPLAQAGHRVTGLDASPHMLEIARQKLARSGAAVEARARLVQGDMRSFTLDGPFDLAIIAVKSFAYLTDRADQLRTLSTVAAHLRPGGLLALDLLNPSPEWVGEAPGSLRQDLVQHVPEWGLTVARTEAVVDVDRAAQVRVIRSAYELVAADGAVTKRFVEWPYRYTYRFEAEHLLERAGFTVEALYGGYAREPFTSTSSVMLFLARRD
jgi:SAM-dependent methyltransferase